MPRASAKRAVKATNEAAAAARSGSNNSQCNGNQQQLGAEYAASVSAAANKLKRKLQQLRNALKTKQQLNTAANAQKRKRIK